MSGNFAVRGAVISGGASGIGLAVAKLLGRQGARLVLADLPGERLEQAAAQLGAESIAAKAVACDVRDLADVERLADAAFAELGAVDLVFNNAGIGGPRGRLWEVDSAEARAHFDVNYWGVWNGCHAFAPRLVAQDRPSAIYNTGSENSLFSAVPQSGTYLAAKHAVLGLTEGLREDLPPHVHAGLVIPGWVHTGIGPDAVMRNGMPVDRFAEIIVPQMLARERFVVSHAYNVVRIDERMEALERAYAAHAPRYPGDEEYDVRTVMERMRNRPKA